MFRGRGALAWIALAPAAFLLADPGGLAPFGPLKWLAIPVLVLVGAATARPWRVPPRVALALAAFLVVATFAALTGADGLYAWFGTPERHFGLITWLLCGLALVGGASVAAEQRPRVTQAMVATAGLVGLWGTAEVLGWQPIALVGDGDRAGASFGSSAYLGAAMALLVPVCLGHARQRWTIVCSALAVVALVASGARAAWVGVGVAAVAALIAQRRRPSWRVTAAAVVVAGGIAFATGVAGDVPGLWRDRDGGAQGRLDEWRVALRVIADHPVTGVGPEGYRIAFPQAVDDAYERAHGRAVVPDRAHSGVLDIAATTGVTGLVAYGALLAFLAPFVWRGLRSERAALVGSAAGLVGYGTQWLFLFPIAELEPVAWLLAGLLIAEVARHEELVTIEVPAFARGLAVALAAVALAGGGVDVAADRRARTILDVAAVGRASDPEAAASLRPDQARYRLVAARGHESVASLVKARAQLDAALDVSPRDPVLRSERARLMLARARQTQDPAEARAALAALDAVAADDPRNAEVLLRLGLARQMTGDHAGAERAWRRAEYLAPRSAAASTNLAVAYAAQGRVGAAKAAARRALARDPKAERAREILRGLSGTGSGPRACDGCEKPRG